MKTNKNNIFLYAVNILISFIIFFTLLCNIAKINNTNKNIQFLLKKIERKTHRDSLILEHYRECSFIADDQIEIGFDNYLRIKK